MKSLSNYIQEQQTQAFTEFGAFFAFSQAQFDEKALPDVKYVAAGAGLIVIKDNLDALMTRLDHIVEVGIKADIAENGIENIIERELMNHEATYTMDYMDTFEALDGYGVTQDQVESGLRKLVSKENSSELTL